MVAPQGVLAKQAPRAPRKLQSIELALSSRRENSRASPVVLPVDEMQLPLHFHTFPTTPPRAGQEALQIRRAAMFTGVSAFQMGLIHIIAGM